MASLAAPADPELERLIDDAIHRCYELGHTHGSGVEVYQQDTFTLSRRADAARNALLAYLAATYVRRDRLLAAEMSAETTIRALLARQQD